MSKTKAVLVIIAGCLIIGLGFAGGLLVASPSRPAVLAEAPKVYSVPVITTEFSDARNVELTPVFSPPESLVLAASGRITGSSCSDGKTFSNGNTNVSVDGFAIVNLSTSIPMWRDLKAGDAGPDVLALQDQLSELGFNAEGDGAVGPLTLQAVADLLYQQGNVDFQAGSIPMGAFLWLPRASVTVSNCSHFVGKNVESGDSIASVRGALTSLFVSEKPKDLEAAPYQVLVDGVALPLDTNLSVTEAKVLEQALALPSISELSRITSDAPSAEGTGASSVSGKLELVKTEQVNVVPPSAVFGISDSQGCVAYQEETYVVDIVGSELGQTFVRFADAPPKAVAASPHEDLKCKLN